jgi:hypothetical protein
MSLRYEPLRTQEIDQGVRLFLGPEATILECDRPTGRHETMMLWVLDVHPSPHSAMMSTVVEI